MQDLLYNTSKSTGYIHNILRYRKQKMKPKPISVDRVSEETDEFELTEDIKDLSLHEKTYTEEEKSEIFTFFKSCFVQKEKALLLEKLEKTVKLRSEMMKMRQTNIAEWFPFYFSSPDIVS